MVHQHQYNVCVCVRVVHNVIYSSSIWSMWFGQFPAYAGDH